MFTLVWEGLKKNMYSEVKKRLHMAIEDLKRYDIPKDAGALLCVLKKNNSTSKWCVEVFHLIECAEKIILDDIGNFSDKNNHHIFVQISWIESPEYLTTEKTMLLEVYVRECGGTVICDDVVFECINPVLRSV